MQPEIRACLHDVLQAIGETESFFAGQPLNFTRYKQDVRTRRATERNLKIKAKPSAVS